MGLYVVMKHLVVLLETKESREARETNPRKRPNVARRALAAAGPAPEEKD